MCRSLCLLLGVVVLSGCAWTNPQPSPGTGDAPGGGGVDRTDLGRAPFGGDATSSVAPDGGGLPDALPATDTAATPDGAPDAATTPADATPDGASDAAPDVVAARDAGPDGADALPAACAACAAPYPACVAIDGEWVCVPCTRDEHCGFGCDCDGARFTCVGDCVEPIPGCDAGGEAECAAQGLACVPEGPACYDPLGFCAPGTCNQDAGSACSTYESILGLPDNPQYELPSLCTCSEPVPGGEALCAQTGDCPPSECWPGQACVPVPFVCSKIIGNCPVIPDGGVCAGPGFSTAFWDRVGLF